MKAFILTAGKGTRLAPVTQTFPKPAVPLLNIPLVCYSLELYRAIGINQFIFNLHHLPAEMRECLNSLKLRGETFEFSDESNGILGSAGCIKRVSQSLELGDQFFMGNGDECLLPENSQIMNSLLQTHLNDKNLATLLVKTHPDVGTKFGGIWLDAQNKVRHIGKTLPNISEASLWMGMHYTGYMVLSNEILANLELKETNIFYDVLLPLIEKGARVGAIKTEGFWEETGNPTDFLKTTRILLDQAFTGGSLINTYLDKYAPSSRLFRSDTYKALATEHHNELLSKSEGFVVAHPRANIKSQIKIKDSVLMPSSNAQSDISQTILV